MQEAWTRSSACSSRSLSPVTDVPQSPHGSIHSLRPYSCAALGLQAPFQGLGYSGWQTSQTNTPAPVLPPSQGEDGY